MGEPLEPEVADRAARHGTAESSLRRTLFSLLPVRDAAGDFTRCVAEVSGGRRHCRPGLRMAGVDWPRAVFPVAAPDGSALSLLSEGRRARADGARSRHSASRALSEFLLEQV